MTDATPVRRVPRRLLLAAAVVAGVIAAAALEPAPSARRDAVLHAALVSDALAQTAPAGEAAKPAPQAPKDAAAEPPGASGPADKAIDAEITVDKRGVTVRKGGNGRRSAEVIVGDHEFDSFEDFVEQAPWLAGLVFMVTALVFLVPLLVIILVIWYKVRRTRMMNETMLRLAEHGVVPPAEAMEAIATGSAANMRDVPPAAPLYEQAKALRKREAWSDLRKGVLIGGVGLGLTFFSMVDDGSANGLGLVLLFVGIGYTILWYLEDKPARATRGTPQPPGGA